MNDAPGMQSRHAGQQLVTDVHCLAGFELCRFLEAGIQSLPLQQSHAQEQKGRGRLVTPKNLVNGTKVGMNHFAGENDLLLKASRSRGIGCDFRPDDFQSNAGVLKKLIFRLVDLAHPSTRNKTNDRKTIGDELTGLETARADRSAGGSRSRGAIRSKCGFSQKTTGLLIPLQKPLDPAPEFRSIPAGSVEEGRPALRR
jgi:hypothetical protein